MPEATGEALASAKTFRPAQRWLERIAQAEQAFQPWQERCRNIDRLYAKADRPEAADREYSLFWANLEVLRPASYARPPVPVVSPRFKDGNPLAREASESLERALIVSFEQNDLDGCLVEVRDEFLRYGRGTAWARLGSKPDGTPCVEYDHVNGDDFLHDLARSWREVDWVARRSWLTQDEGIARFGEAFREVPRVKRDPDAAIPDRADKAPVWEIWCKSERSVYWVAPDHEDMLDEQPTFLDLSGFFPCPRPAYGTLAPKSLIPVPEIVQYKDQIEEINTYTARIAALSEALRLKGFYPAGAGDLSEAIETAMRSTDERALLVPLSTAAAFGGASLKDSIAWLPVDIVVQIITSLVELRRVVIEDVYQITGISDIVRGQADGPRKTATEQQLKSQWGSLRIQERQRELVRFARDMTRIAAEIIAENFPPDVLFDMAQSRLPTQEQKRKQHAMLAAQQAQQAAPMAVQGRGEAPESQSVPVPEPLLKGLERSLKRPTQEEVAAFLADDRARGFVVEIETDSTIQPDEDAEKARRIEFVTAVGGLVQRMAPLILQAPFLGPLAVETVKFAAAGFRAGRPLEAAIDQLGELIDGLAAQAAAAQGAGDPLAEAKAQAELGRVEIEKARAAHDKEEADRRFAFDVERTREELAIKERESRQAMALAQGPETAGHYRERLEDGRTARQETRADAREAGAQERDKDRKAAAKAKKD